MNLLNLIPIESRLAVAAGALALALVAAGTALHHYGNARFQAGGAAVQAQWNAEKLQSTTTALQASEDNRTEGARRVTAQAQSQKEADHDKSTLETDRAAAGAAADGVRGAAAKTAAAARGGCPAAHPAPGIVGPPAGDPIGVLADVLARADARAGVLAEYADRAAAAGRQCERDYDALTAVTPAGL